MISSGYMVSSVCLQMGVIVLEGNIYKSNKQRENRLLHTVFTSPVHCPENLRAPRQGMEFTKKLSCASESVEISEFAFGIVCACSAYCELLFRFILAASVLFFCVEFCVSSHRCCGLAVFICSYVHM